MDTLTHLRLKYRVQCAEYRVQMNILSALNLTEKLFITHPTLSS